MEEMQSTEDKIDFKLLKDDYREMCRITGDMGALTVTAHLRSSGRQDSVSADELIYFGKNATWKTALLQLAIDYAQQINTYYLQFAGENVKAALNRQERATKMVTTAE